MGQIDNAGVISLNIIEGGMGYIGDVPPLVTISAPQYGSKGAKASAMLAESGRLASLELMPSPCSYRYQSIPEVKLLNNNTRNRCMHLP